MPVYEDLRKKTVLVTGGANGIGAATVRAFHEQGAQVFFCDKDDSAGKALALELPGTFFARVDLLKENQIVRWVKKVLARSPAIHVLVNNAAFDPRIPLENTTARAWDNLLALNLRAYFLCAREVAPHMPRRLSAIINLSSITYHQGPAQMSAYVASKSAIIGLTRSLARELGRRGIRVNTLSPGWVMTDRQLREHVRAETKRLIKASQCIPDLLQPGEMAHVILFLASECSSAITGQEILADRGWFHA